MDRTKYVIIETFACELAIVFDEIISHHEVGRNFKIVSAGFCSIRNNKVTVWGKSDSLGKESREEDAEIISKSLCLQTG